jgi:hypothetical protein
VADDRAAIIPFGRRGHGQSTSSVFSGRYLRILTKPELSTAFRNRSRSS